MLTLILMLTFHTAFGLVGYICSETMNDISRISLNEIVECNGPLVEPMQEETNIQLLQLSEFTSTKLVECKVTINRTIHECNDTSSIPKHEIYLHELDEKACMKMQEKGTFKLTDSCEIMGLMKNGTTTRKVILAGSMPTDKQCSGSEYSDPFGMWNNVFVQGTVQIILKNYNAQANLKTGKVTLQSEKHCSLNERFCMDFEGSTAFWKTEPMETCDFKNYDVLFEGQSKKLLSRESGTRFPDVYALKKDETIFALAAISKKEMCGYTFRRTLHPKLYILENCNGTSFTSRKKMVARNLDIFSYVNSKFLYVEKHVKVQIKDVYKDMLIQRCELEKQVLENTLSRLTNPPELFARAVMKKPGYTAIIVGEVAHIIKCIPVECTLKKESENCYEELGVMYKNETFYMSPISRILKPWGIPVECDWKRQIQYIIHGKWYSFSPLPNEIPPPQILEPSSLSMSGYDPVEEQESSDINTDGIVVSMSNSRGGEAVARNVHSYPASSEKTTFHVRTLNEPVANADPITNFLQFGSVSAGLFAILVVLTMIKAVIDTCIHGYNLHSEHGCSYAFFQATYNSILNLIITLVQIQNTAPRGMNVNINEPRKESGASREELQEVENDRHQSTNISLVAMRRYDVA